MNKKKSIRLYGLFAVFISILLFSSGCIEPSPYCPSRVHVDLTAADSYAINVELPFCFPINNISQIKSGARFAEYRYSNSSPTSKEYHAAEDYGQIPGTPVFAMADGVVSFSGPRKGYGWLIIIDHPENNLYSLYGHLSSSRWYIESGENVEKGQLIAYLGDSDENGGSVENPLYPHLHFGIRVGQRADYPNSGEWRWSAGWIKYCPQDLGWLQPSFTIVNQEIPSGGFQKPQAGFIEIWWGEILISGLLIIGAISLFILNKRKRKLIFLILSSGFLGFGTWFSFAEELKISYAMLTLCILLVIIESFKLTILLTHRN